MPRASLGLWESWVVEGEDDGEETKQRDPDPTEPRKTPLPEHALQRARRKKSPPASSSDPELVMPRLDSKSIDGSWSHAGVGAKRRSNFMRPASEPRETRSRTTARRLENESSPEHQSTRGSSPEDFGSLKRRKERKKIADNRTREATGVNFISKVITGSAMWCIDVIGSTFHHMKIPISYFLAALLFFGLIFMARNLMAILISTFMSPICRIPGASFLNLPFCPGATFGDNNGPQPSVEFNELMAMQSKFEEVLEETARNVGLPMELKRGEASLRDLRQLVRYSNIHSKNELELEFDGFIDTAKITSFDLQKFNGHVGRAVDSVIATTRWTSRILDSIQTHDSSRGLISALFNNRLLAPFQTVRYTESLLLDQYIKHTQIVEEEIYKLIDEAQALLIVLNSLEDRLDIIHGIVSRDHTHAIAKRDEILAHLWTIVGGNRGKLSNMNKQLGLLQEIGNFRKSASKHVSGTIIKLQTIAAGVEDLRERVGSPALLRDRLDIPLSIHIENIERGVERLDEARQNARRVENEHIRQILERGSLGRSLIEQ